MIKGQLIILGGFAATQRMLDGVAQFVLDDASNNLSTYQSYTLRSASNVNDLEGKLSEAEVVLSISAGATVFCRYYSSPANYNYIAVCPPEPRSVLLLAKGASLNRWRSRGNQSLTEGLFRTMLAGITDLGFILNISKFSYSQQACGGGVSTNCLIFTDDQIFPEKAYNKARIRERGIGLFTMSGGHNTAFERPEKFASKISEMLNSDTRVS